LPTKEKLYQEFADKGLTILAVSFGENETLVHDFQNEFKLSLPVLYDPGDETARQYGVRGHPVTFIVDRKGLLVGKVIGERDWSGKAARALITELLTAGR